MVRKEEVLTGLLVNLPGGQGQRATEIKDLYSGIDTISVELISALESGQTENFRWLFALIEKYLRDGDQEVQELISYGLIDHMQEGLIRKERKLSAFDTWLRPETKVVWQNMIDVWSLNDKRDY